MLHKTMIALFAVASVGMLAPSAASARGGFHGGGFGGSGFRSTAIGGGSSFRSAAIGTAGAAAVGTGSAVAVGSAGVRSGTFAANSFRGRGFHHGFRHHRGFALGVFGVGPYAYHDDYDYPYYAYDDSYYDDGGCYIVQRRVHTRYGWRLHPVQVCGLSLIHI